MSHHASPPQKTESMITYKEYLNQYFSDGDLPITKTLDLIHELSNRYHSLYVPKSDLELLKQLSKDFPDFKLTLPDFNILVNNVAAWVNNHYSQQQPGLLSHGQMMATGLGILAPESTSGQGLLLTTASSSTAGLDPSSSPVKSLSNSSVYSLFGNPMTDKKNGIQSTSPFQKKEPASSPLAHNNLASKLQKLISEKNALLNQINEIEAKYLHQVASQKRTIDGLRSSNQQLWQRVSSTLKRSHPLSSLGSSLTEPVSVTMKELESNLEATIQQREAWSKELNVLQQELDALKDKNKSKVLENDKTFQLDFKLLEQKNTEFVGKLLALSQKISELNPTIAAQSSKGQSQGSHSALFPKSEGLSLSQNEGTALSAKELESSPSTRTQQETIDLRQDYSLPGMPQPFKRPEQDGAGSSSLHFSGFDLEKNKAAQAVPLQEEDVAFYTPKKHLNPSSLGKSSSRLILPMTLNPTVQDDSYALDKGTTVMAELLQLYAQLEDKMGFRDQLLRHASNRLHETTDEKDAIMSDMHRNTKEKGIEPEVGFERRTSFASTWLDRTKVKPILNSLLVLFLFSCILYGLFVYMVHIIQAPHYSPY